MSEFRVRPAYWEEHREVRRLSRWSKEHCQATWDFQNIHGLKGYYDRGDIGITHDLSGFICVRHLKQTSRPYTSIYYLGVKPEMRRKGVGAALVAWALMRSPHDEIRLKTEVWNHGAILFYRRLGFEITGSSTTKKQVPLVDFSGQRGALEVTLAPYLEALRIGP